MKHLKRDVFRLASTYLIIIMVMSVGLVLCFIRHRQKNSIIVHVI